MLVQWTGVLVGDMHNEKITKTQLAQELGITREQVSAVLNGHCEPKGAETRYRAAFDRIVARKRSVMTTE